MTKSERNLALTDVDLSALTMAGEPRDLWMDGKPRWHCLKSKRGKDFAMAAWLKRRGAMEAFTPVQIGSRRIRGKSVRHVRRYLPSYVFVLFPGPVVWHAVLASPLVQDTIRLSTGQPAALEPDDLRLIRSMKDIDAAAARRARAKATIRKGDRVRVVTGVLCGTESDVLELRGGRVRLRVRMFSAEIAAEVDAAELVKVNGRITIGFSSPT